MKSFMIFILCLIMSICGFAQVSINADGTPPNGAAGLDINYTNKGFLPPRMTTAQQNAISSPVEGLIIYNTDSKTLNIYTGTSWVQLIPANMIWTCGGEFLDLRDNKTYSTVQIGSQCWMAKNLNLGKRINGTVAQTNNGIIEKYCYLNTEISCDWYGAFYQWEELMNYTTSSNSNPSGRQGICPAGWHIPSDAEWTQLTTFLGGESIAGGKMKEETTSYWSQPNTGATNSSGFTAMPWGYRQSNGTFANKSINAYFWSSTENTSTTAWFRRLAYDSEGVLRQSDTKSIGLSVRCLKD